MTKVIGNLKPQDWRGVQKGHSELKTLGIRI